MEYENIDEATKREACERVKQIVKAIKAIKIKYYLNFSKISAKDRERYQKLESNLEKISEEYNLNKLKVALMSELSTKYDVNDKNNLGEEKQHEPDDILNKCRGAVDAEMDALSRGRITQSRKCQEQLKKYMEKLDTVRRQDITNYKRDKLFVLGLTIEQGMTKKEVEEKIEEKNKSWNNNMKSMCKIKHADKRRDVYGIIGKLQNKERQISIESQEKMMTI